MQSQINQFREVIATLSSLCLLSALGCHEDSALGLSQQAVQGEFVLDQLLHLDYDRAMVHCSAGVACAQGHFAAGLVSDAVALFLQLQLRWSLIALHLIGSPYLIAAFSFSGTSTVQHPRAGQEGPPCTQRLHREWRA